MAELRVTYDGRADAAYIHLKHIGNGEVFGTRDLDPYDWDIHVDFDEGDVLLGIEVLNASRRLPAGLLAQAERIDLGEGE